ncbi:hypothetical protein PV326_011222 [Microctonus aethiopoides]|nr:hypothetical protein PV326_011222 [Microctonus aethiopoides]
MQSQNFNHVTSCPYLPGTLGQHMKKSSMSESSSDIMELEDGILIAQAEVNKKSNCNSRHNNNITPTYGDSVVAIIGTFVHQQQQFPAVFGVGLCDIVH